MNPHDFASPGPDYRGVTLWMMNDELSVEEAARQVEGFADAGWGAFITRTFNGLRTEYLSDEWHATVERAVEVARERSLKVWLQAGYMPAAVPEIEPEKQHQVLIETDAGDSPAPGEALLLDRDGRRYLSRRKEHVLDLLDPDACREYVDGAYEKPISARYSADLGATVETVWVDEPHFNPPDLPWSSRLPARFRELWGYDIVERLPSLFSQVDDFRMVRHHYWRTVLQMLSESYFASVRDWCQAHGVLFSGHLMGEDTLQGQIAWTAACMPLYEYMGLPGIDHLTASLEWPAARPFILPPKQCSSAASQLGSERVLAEMYGVSTQALSFRQRKRIAAHLMMLGINYRCYHGSFYSLRGRRKRIYAPHLSFQQPWWEENRTVADYFARFSYLLRQGRYAADILLLHPVESAFCLYDKSGMVNVHDRENEEPEVRRLNDAFAAASEHLLRLHHGFEYGDETLMARHGRVADGRLSVGESSFSCVVLPPLLTLRASTVALLVEFKARGGSIVALEQLPDRIDGRSDGAAAARLAALLDGVPLLPNAAEALGLALDRLVERKVVLEAADGEDAGVVWLHERTVSDGTLIALHNTSADRTIDLRLRARDIGDTAVFEQWHLETGRVSVPPQASGTGSVTCDLRLPPLDITTLLLRNKPSVAEPAPTLQPARSIALPPDYEVCRCSPNALTLDVCRYRTDGAWSEPMPVMAVQELLADRDYRGDVTLGFAFAVDVRPAELAVAVEDADECRIAVNGTEVRYAGLRHFVDPSFKPVDIAHAIREGENTIEVSRRFEPPAQPKFRLGGLFQRASGVELESIYLIGSFGIVGEVSTRAARPDAVRLAPAFRLGAEPARSNGELLLSGYAFFAGRLILRRVVQLLTPAADERVFLCYRSVHAAVAVVRVNGTRCGTLAWEPYAVDITDAVAGGENVVEIELCTSLRNLLGPHHRPSGEPSQVWADGWTGRSTEGRRDTNLVAGPEWVSERAGGRVFWTDDYFVVPFGISDGAIEFRRPV